MNFRSIHTAYGLRRMAQAEVTGVPIKLAFMAVGDGGGQEMYPDINMTQLVREIAGTRIAPNAVYQDPDDSTKFSAELVLPKSQTGFTVREVGIFDDAGGLFAIGNLPTAYLPHESEGAFGDATVRMDFMVTNADIVTIQVDATVATVTRKWIGENITVAKLLPGGRTGQILKKRSNRDGDVLWEDPGQFTVVVSTIEEEVVLEANQIDVKLEITSTVGLAVYVKVAGEHGGERLAQRAGEGGWLPHPVDEFRLTLGNVYPAGTRLTAVQNEPASQLTGALQEEKNLADLEDVAEARENLGVYSKEQADQLAPVSLIAYFAQPTAPSGWLKANGSAVSRTAYKRLFEVINTIYGEGDGLNTFNLPDLRGEFLRGWDDGRGADSGRELGSGQASQNLAHTHNGSTDTAGSHSHTVSDGRPINPSGRGLAGGSDFPGVHESITTRGTSVAGSHSHTIMTNPSGGTEARPRNVALLACIKY
jgi:phage-related tail fiber protein